MLELVRAALAGDRFELYLQPIDPVVTGPCAPARRAEFLLRLPHDGQVLLPAVFLPVAERYDLMRAVDQWVIEHAVEALATRYHPHYAGADLYSINLSAASLADNVLLGVLHRSLARTGLPASILCFELTETVAVTNLDRATHVIRELRRAGCSFALDDFGRGLSSFNYLKNLPLDLLKVDGSFVRNLASDRFDQAMVASVVQVAHTLGIGIVAEYVESAAILDHLQRLGADYAQGYQIGRPVPAADFFSAAHATDHPLPTR